MNNKLNDSFLSNDLSIKKYTDSLSEWNNIVSSSVQNGCHADVKSIEYFIEYFGGQNIDYESISSVVFHNSKAVAVIILELEVGSKGKFLTSNGSHILQPIYAEGISKKVEKKINNSLFHFIDTLKNESFKFSFKYEITENGCSDWYISLINNYQFSELEHNLYINLGLSLDLIKLNFRKSYRPLITKGVDLWKTEIIDSTSKQIESKFLEFKNFHIFISGKKTRSDKSWDIQYEMIKNAKAFLVCIYENKNLLGAGLFQINERNASYAVGVYDREKFDLPLGHVVQFKAIEYMKEIGIYRYNLGIRYYESQQESASKKEISISHFKEGFANLILPTVVFR
tara:strand:+ start:11640 stop:12662 length:1023 start_codon:yes stop_codon:yes gene_type:complete